MNKKFTLLTMLVLSVFGLSFSSLAQTTDLIISEYAEGSGNNKYLELYNGTGDSVNLADYVVWRISNGGSWTEYTTSLTGWLQDGDVIVLANSSADTAITNLPNATTAFTTASYFNGDDAMGLAKDDGTGTYVLIDAVGMQGPDPGSGWPVAGIANATANHTMIRKPCIMSPDTNWTLNAGTNMYNSQWIVLAQNTWHNAGTHDTVCTPTYPISTVNTTDANGVADSLGVYCWTKGVVLGIDMDGNTGISFTIYDGTEGLGVYNYQDVSDYVVTEGDSILIRGTIGQFNGLTQIGPDMIYLLNTGNTIPTPTVVTTLDETTESQLVKFENALVTGISGANYTLVSGTDTIRMRIDSDTDVLDSLTIAMGDSLCSITGIGGQYDNSNPYTSGYQLFPRRYTDIDTTCGIIINPPPPTAAPTYPINVVNTTDVDGVSDSLGVYCWVKGVVLGVNMSGSAVSFTMWDNGGIGVYGSASLGYVVNEGDSIALRGNVSQFNGLTQMSPDSITLLNTGNTIPTPTIVTSLGEATESNLVTFESALVFANSGSNYTLVSGNDTIMMRVDSDTDVLDSLSISVGDSLCSVTGIGGQYDNSSPYTSGYQLFPRYYTDIDTTCGGIILPPVVINTYDIATVRTVDANGETDSLGVYCKLEGIVYGVDLGGNRMSFTIIDETDGINIYTPNPISNYVVKEGDEIRAIGEIIMYNGLTELLVDSIVVISTGNCIPFPMVVESLSENTESNYIELKNVTLVDPTLWPTAGNDANLDVITENGDTLTMRLDRDSRIQDTILNAPSGKFNLIGIGGQYDNSAPYFDGYQIFPMFITDIDSNEYAAPANLIMNEVAIKNDATFADNAGSYYQWVEMYNSGATMINVSGYFISNDSNDVFKVQLPRCFNNTSFDMTFFPGLYGVGFLDNDGSMGPQYFDLVLTTSMPYVALYTPNGTLVDGLEFPTTLGVEGHTFGARNDDHAQGDVTFEVGTPEATNAIGVVLSVLSANSVNAINVYPNPTNTGSVNFNKTVSITVYSITGQTVMVRENINQLDVSSLESGVYIIETTEGEIVKMIVK